MNIKHITLAALLSVGVSFASAQTQPEATFGEEKAEAVTIGSVSVQIGTDFGSPVPVPFSNIPKHFNPKPRFYPSIGLKFDFPIKNSWHIGAEASFKKVAMKADARIENQKFSMDNGQGREDMYFSGSAQADMAFSMIEVPVYAKYYFGKKKNNIALLGFYGAYYLDGKFVTDPKKGYVGSDPDIAQVTDMSTIIMDFSPFLSKWDIGMTCGYERNIIDNLDAGVRFSMGFKNILKSDTRYFDYSMLNMRGTIVLSYRFFKK